MHKSNANWTSRTTSDKSCEVRRRTQTKNSDHKRQFRRQFRIEISTTNSNRNSRSRIDQDDEKDEFEIRRQMRDEKTNLKFKALDSRSRNSRSRIEQRTLRSRIEQRSEKDEFEIRHENSRNLNSKFESKIEIREIE